MAVLLMVLVAVLFLFCISSALLRLNEVRYRKKGLPPGTMGWPVFGETTEFLKQGPNFMKNQRARWLFAWILIHYVDGVIVCFFSACVLASIISDACSQIGRSCVPSSCSFGVSTVDILLSSDFFLVEAVHLFCLHPCLFMVSWQLLLKLSSFFSFSISIKT